MATWISFEYKVRRITDFGGVLDMRVSIIGSTKNAEWQSVVAEVSCSIRFNACVVAQVGIDHRIKT